jgi:hypothetical protein
MRSTAAYIATAVFSLVATSFLPSDASAQQVPAEFPLKGQWKYQSFRPKPELLVVQDQKPVFVDFSPVIGDVTIDGEGRGKLIFNIPANGATPAYALELELKMELVISGDGAPKLSCSAIGKLPNKADFINKLEGYLVPADLSKPPGTGNPLVVRGAVVQTTKAAAPQYTTGFFVMERK